MNNIYLKTIDHGTHEVISIDLIDNLYHITVYIDQELIYEFAGDNVKVSQFVEFGGFIAILVKVDDNYRIKQINHVVYMDQNIDGFDTEPFEGNIFKV